MRARVGMPATLQVTFRDGEDPVDPGVVTVTIAGFAGQVATGPAGGTGNQARTFTITPASVDTWTVTWAGAGRTLRTHVDVVGDHYVELTELRQTKGLEDAAMFPTALLQQARDAAEDKAEEVMGVSYVRRHRRLYLTGTDRLLPVVSPQTILAASVDGIAPLDLPTLYRGDLSWPSAPADDAQVVLDVEAGYDHPPDDLREAVKTYARHLALGARSRIPERATMMTTEAGTFNLAVAGKGRPTGLPDVDATLQDRAERQVVFA